MRVVLIRHGDDPDNDRIVTFFRSRNINPQIIRPYLGEALGDIDDVAACAIYGGPYNVFEEDKYPFLHQENAWIEQCLKHDVPLLGICQGAQSIARVLGAEVGPKAGEPFEFGYYPIVPTEAGREYFPDVLGVAQAHYHEFQIPAGARLLASSELFAQQAFGYGDRVFGFQFHPEIIPDAFRLWQHSKAYAYGRPGVQSREQQALTMQQYDGAMHDWFMAFQQRLYGDALARCRAS